MPLTDVPEIFGLHTNAEISSALMEKNALLKTVLNLLPRTGKPTLLLILTLKSRGWAETTRRNNKGNLQRHFKSTSRLVRREIREEKTSSCVHEFDEYRSLIGGAQVQQTAWFG